MATAPDLDPIAEIQQIAEESDGKRRRAGQGAEQTDTGNATRFALQHGDRLRWVKRWDSWCVFDGKRWHPDDADQVLACGKKTARALIDEAREEPDDDKRSALLKFTTKSQDVRRIKAMIELAKPDVAAHPDEFDRDAWLLNVNNGTLDLRHLRNWTTVPLRPHDVEDRITQLAPVDYSPTATAPTWDRVLAMAFEGAPEVAEFVQRAAGLSLVGEILERVLLILYGIGRNGKSTVLEALAGALGDYAAIASMSTFMEAKGDRIPNDLARLRAARFVSSAESDDRNQLDVSMVKRATGGDTMTARFMRGEWFEFSPKFTIWLATNSKPKIPDAGDQAVWDRLCLIPFENRIPDDQVIAPAELQRRLAAERPGILNWALIGLADYLNDGLRIPQAVRAATAEYRDESDIVGEFLADRCSGYPTGEISKAALYKAYSAWAEDRRVRPFGSRRFNQAVAQHGYGDERRMDGYYWLGLSIL